MWEEICVHMCTEHSLSRSVWLLQTVCCSRHGKGTPSDRHGDLQNERVAVHASLWSASMGWLSANESEGLVEPRDAHSLLFALVFRINEFSLAQAMQLTHHNHVHLVTSQLSAFIIAKLWRHEECVAWVAIVQLTVTCLWQKTSNPAILCVTAIVNNKLLSLISWQLSLK